MSSFKFIFFGTSQFAVPILEKLMAENLRPSLVITTPDKSVGRKRKLTPSPIKQKAEEFGLSIYQPESLKSKETEEKIQQEQPKIFIVASYGKIIPQNLIDISPKGALNVHPSLLPQYRGPSPIQTAILNGDQETGVTIMLMDERLDHGPILNRKKIIINKDETYQSLHYKLSRMGANLLIETLVLWLKDKIKPARQNHSQATYTKLLKKEDGQIDWLQNAREIETKVRALNPWPGTFTFWDDKRLKIIETKIIADNFNLKPQEFGRTKNNKLIAGTGNGFLEITKLQPESKNIQKNREFINGNKDKLALI